MQLLMDTAIPMRDGVCLRGDAFIHDDPRPTILVRTALDEDRLSHDFVRPMQCARAGYAVLVQDVRGRFASEGTFSLSARQDADDTQDTIAWLAAQPWCDGRVGMVGGSHAAVSQLAAAVRQTPHLAAISPAMAPLPEHDLEIHGGASLFDVPVGVVAYLSLAWLDAELAAGRISVEDGAALRALALDPPSLLERRPSGRAFEPLARFLDAMPRDPAGRVPIRAEALTVPSLFVTGWFDFCASGVLRLFREAQAVGGGGPLVRAAHQLVVGPWIHDLRLAHFVGELLFPADASAEQARLCEQQLAFFDHHLRGAPPPAGPAVRYYLVGANAWRQADTWPPAAARPHDLYLASGGSANGAAGDGRLGAAASGPPDHYCYDPEDPVRSHGGQSFAPSAPGPLSQAHLEGRKDVLCYTTEPLGEALDCVGPVQVTLWAATRAADTDFVARLIDVFPDGRSILVCGGIRRARSQRGTTTGEEPFSYVIELGEIAWRIRPGHRLRLHVASSDFPHFDRNLNTGRAMGAEARGVVAEQTVFHDPERPSRLSLHLLSHNT